MMCVVLESVKFRRCSENSANRVWVAAMPAMLTSLGIVLSPRVEHMVVADANTICCKRLMSINRVRACRTE